MTPDPRLALRRQRRAALDKLALMRVYRASICGCLRCNDLDKAEELDALIARCVEAVDELTEACSTRPVLTLETTC